MLGPILAALAFFVLFVVVYRHFRGFYPSSEFQESSSARSPVPDPDTPRLLFFYTTWCPHSLKAIPEWRSFKEMAQNKTYGGKHLEFDAVDGESAPTKLARYGVEAFPTVVLETSDQIIVYDHAVKAQGVRAWLIQTLGQEA